MNDGEIWLRAWCAVGPSFNAKAADCSRYADTCLKEYRERFPAPKPLETQFCGKPLSELTDEERIEFRRTVNVPVRASGRRDFTE